MARSWARRFTPVTHFAGGKIVFQSSFMLASVRRSFVARVSGRFTAGAAASQRARIPTRIFAGRLASAPPRSLHVVIVLSIPATLGTQPFNGFGRPGVARRLLGPPAEVSSAQHNKRSWRAPCSDEGYSQTHSTLCRRVAAALAASILLPGVAAAQPSHPNALNLSDPAIVGFLSELPVGGRRITLGEAQQLAQAASDPLKRLGELQVESRAAASVGREVDLLSRRRHAIPEPSSERKLPASCCPFSAH